MNTALLLLGVLATTCALPGGYTKQPRQEDYTKQPRFPQFKLPAFAPRNVIACSKKLVTTKLSPGETATFLSPNYPSKYGKKSKCNWRFKSTTDITIMCSDFLLQSQNKKGKCGDKLILDDNIFCGNQLSFYYGGTSVKAIFKSNKKKNFKGFACTVTAESLTSVSTTTSGPGSGTCKCGQANRATRIVGGVETEVMEYPWQAAMVYYGYSSVFCGGSVIGSKHILTAAHCTQAVTDYSISYQVMVGAHGLTSTASSHLLLDAARFIQHSQYDGSSFDNDVSIIVLSDSISFTSTDIRPVCLPTSDANAYNNVNAIVSGWGTLASGGSQPDVLMEVDVPTMSNSDCQNAYGNGITDNMLCAGYDDGGKDACQGDSGGPLFYISGSGYTQIGVVSWGYGCAYAGYPGVYARVTEYLSWISTNSASSTTCSSA